MEIKVKKSPVEGIVAYCELENQYVSATGTTSVEAVENLQFILEEKGYDV